MPLLADYLRDNQGTTWKIFPSTTGELILTTPPTPSESWTEESYTIPTSNQITYQTLADSAGTTWYFYPTPDGEYILTNTAPPSISGVWQDYSYGAGDTVTPDEAATGDEIYLSLADTDGTSWYVYPNADGEMMITNSEPD